MTKKIRNFTVYNDVRIELSNEGIKVIYRDTIKILREIMDRLGILYGNCLLYTSPSPRDTR